jgi:hypothetical protein
MSCYQNVILLYILPVEGYPFDPFALSCIFFLD